MIPTMQPVSQFQVYTKYCISVNGEKLDQVAEGSYVESVRIDARRCSRSCQRPAGSASRSATLSTETSSVQTDGRTERRTVCATRWKRPRDFAMARLSRALMHASVAAGVDRERSSTQKEFVEVDAKPRLNSNLLRSMHCMGAASKYVRHRL